MTSEESFANYEAIKAEVYPHEERDCQDWNTFRGDPEISREIGKRWTEWRDDKERREKEAIRALIPRKGLPCTVCFFTDRRAATVTEVVDSRKVVVRYNKVKCIEYYAGDYKILPETEGANIIFTKRRNGKWIMEGNSTKDGVSLQLHYQDHYIDPHF